mmetsp:Transcript_32152/g.78125  ORF Transcript_32152/g.78125 Transcript_32152/m.78125 type:complete len:339 (+) Transcript_32152:286-1302(+)
MTISPETPQVFQSKQREGFIRGRRSSVASTAERFESETVDDSTNLALSERTFTIRFQAYDEIQTVLHLDNYTNKEIKQSWYRSKDYEKMMMAALEAVRKVGKKKKNQDATDRRGLEAWTPKGAERAKLLKEKAVEAVWNEQSFQWEKGVFDPDRIRDCYTPYSTGALDAARQRGLVDATVYEKEVEKREKEGQKKRNLLSRGKAALRKSIKFTTKSVAKTPKIVGEATSQTGHVALAAGKRTARVGVGVATLDQRMVKEAFAQKSKEAVGSQRFQLPSQMSILLDGDRKCNLLLLFSLDLQRLIPLPKLDQKRSNHHRIRISKRTLKYSLRKKIILKS